MAKDEIATEDAFLFPNEGGTVADISIDSQPKEGMKIEGRKVFAGNLQVTVSNAVNGTCQQNSDQQTSISGDGEWKKDKDKLLRKGRLGNTITIQGTDSVTSSSCSFPVTPKVQLSGQNIAKKVWKVKHP